MGKGEGFQMEDHMIENPSENLQWAWNVDQLLECLSCIHEAQYRTHWV